MNLFHYFLIFFFFHSNFSKYFHELFLDNFYIKKEKMKQNNFDTKKINKNHQFFEIFNCDD